MKYGVKQDRHGTWTVVDTEGKPILASNYDTKEKAQDLADRINERRDR